MCGRYYVDDETAREIEKIVRNLDRKVLLKGEICPGQKASVIVEDAQEAVLKQMEWGFQIPSAKNLIINARSESVLEKKMFSESVLSRRCIIPAGWFYEWDKDKNKIAFRPVKGQRLFMAGIFKAVSEEEHFVILTTEANASVRPIHNRMPLILKENECREWLLEGQQYTRLLNTQPDTKLEIEGYVQQSLFS